MTSDDKREPAIPPHVDAEETAPYGADTPDQPGAAPTVRRSTEPATPTSRMWKLKHPPGAK